MRYFNLNFVDALKIIPRNHVILIGNICSSFSHLPKIASLVNTSAKAQ
jgi:hypothetical protein